MAIKSFKRYEKKFILSNEQYMRLIPKMMKYMEYDEHCRDDSTYSIYTIYYDTKNNDVIRNSISNPYYKEKLRLRSYKTEITPDKKVFIELKKKINGIVSKRRVVVTLEEAMKFINEGVKPKCDDYLNNQVLDELQYYLSKNQVSPNVYISYTRKAFFAKDNRDFRITFDSNILARRYDLSLESTEYGDYILDRDKYLMEVKILGSMPVWFTKILSELKIYNQSFSKYGNEFREFCKNDNKDRKVLEIC